MSNTVPEETIHAFARSIAEEARRYGFGQLDFVRLMNAMMDAAVAEPPLARSVTPDRDYGPFQVGTFPLQSMRVRIRLAGIVDFEILQRWIDDDYGRHFLLSCATAQRLDIDTMLRNPQNRVGIVETLSGRPIGAVAYLDVDAEQRRAELRKLIGDPEFRGQGYAEEATRLWIEYGAQILELSKIYVSTLQTHLRNIRLNESVGFRVEGVLHREVKIADARYDVLRMGLCLDGN